MMMNILTWLSCKLNDVCPKHRIPLEIQNLDYDLACPRCISEQQAKKVAHQMRLKKVA